LHNLRSQTGKERAEALHVFHAHLLPCLVFLNEAAGDLYKGVYWLENASGRSIFLFHGEGNEVAEVVFISKKQGLWRTKEVRTAE
jgi:hypothetical protein